MKAKLITAGLVLAITFVSGNAIPAYAQRGGGHGGGHAGFGGGHSSGGGFHSGGHAYTGGGHAYTGGGHVYTGGGHVYTGGGHIYTGRSAGSGYGNHSARYTSAGIPRNYGTYGHPSGMRPGTQTTRFGAINQSGHTTTTNRTFQNRGGDLSPGSVTTRHGRSHSGSWSRYNPANRHQFNSATQNRLRNWHGRTSNFAEARNHHGNHGRHHGRDWWHNHCHSIILVGGGYWGWYDGWWYPAWGYDPYYSVYDYDGPIYGYDGLPPDEAVANVQSELQRLGYYSGQIDGVFGWATQDALQRYQSDRGLSVTGTIDQPTVRSLGLG